MDKELTIRDFITSQCPGIPNATKSSVKSAGGFSFMRVLDKSVGFFLGAISPEESKQMIATVVAVQLEDPDEVVTNAVVNVKTEDGAVANDEEETVFTPGQAGVEAQDEVEEESDTSGVPSQQDPASNDNVNNGVDVHHDDDTKIPAAGARSDAGAGVQDNDGEYLIGLTKDDGTELQTTSVAELKEAKSRVQKLEAELKEAGDLVKALEKDTLLVPISNEVNDGQQSPGNTVESTAQDEEEEESDSSGVPSQQAPSSNNNVNNGVDVHHDHETEIPAAGNRIDAGAVVQDNDRKDQIDLTEDDEDEIETPHDAVAAASHDQRTSLSSLHELTLRCRGLDLNETNDLCRFYELWEDYELFRKFALMDLRKKQLVKMCEDMCLTSTGNKDDLASRIVEVEKDHFICEHVMSDGDKKPKSNTNGNNAASNEVGNPQEDFDIGSKRPAGKFIIPPDHTKQLADRLLKLTGFIADEEQMNGNRVFSWNIMSPNQIKYIAAEVPTTAEELVGCGLPENVVNAYGERLLKSINEFIETNNLQNYVDNNPKKKSKFN